MAELNRFVVAVSDDPVKRDPELRCAMCGEHLCDIEHGDTLETLVSVADNHVCTPKVKG